MRMMNKTLMIAMGALFVLLLVTLACGDDSGETFKIGVMESVTGPGDTYGNVAVQAKQMAVDEIKRCRRRKRQDAGVGNRGLQVLGAGRDRRL